MSLTQLQVIQKFMKSLDDSATLERGSKGWQTAAKALDEAVAACSNGMFRSMQAVINSYLNDLSRYGTTTRTYNMAAQKTFLSKYCGIVMGNADTGAITGADAGSGPVKTASSIVPEPRTAAVYPTASRTTIRGLTFVWPTASELGTRGTASYNAKRAIVAQLNSWWAASALDLIRQSYGLSFQERQTTVKQIKVRFYTKNDNQLAYVHEDWHGDGHTFNLTLNINLKYYSSIAAGDRDGKSKQTSAYLDRTLAHELTHAAMAANITNFGNLPLWVTEGLAELVHGIDDERAGNLYNLTNKANVNYERKLFTYNQQQQYNCGGDSYAGGYLLFRYLAKKVSDASKYVKPKPTPKPAATYGYTNGGLTVMLYSNYKSTGFAANSKVATIDASRTTGTLALRGNAKNNTIVLGKGMDTVLYGRGYGSDTVRGFKSGRDQIRTEKGRVQSLTASGGHVYLRYGKGKNVLTLVGMQNKTFRLDGRNTVVMDQNHAATVNYAVNTTYYGSTRFVSTLRVTNGGTVSMSNGTLKNIRALDARSSVRAVTLTGSNQLSTTLYGSRYSDRLYGGRGHTTFYAGAGNDQISCGAGKDTIYYEGGTGSDIVRGFDAAKDEIRGKAPWSIVRNGNNVYLRYDNRGSMITLENMRANTLLVNGRRVGVKVPVSSKTWDARNGARSVTMTGASNVRSYLYGSVYNDVLRSGGADTVFYGGRGNDVISCGRGRDTIFFGMDDGNDTVYNIGKTDLLYLYDVTSVNWHWSTRSGKTTLAFTLKNDVGRTLNTITVQNWNRSESFAVMLKNGRTYRATFVNGRFGLTGVANAAAPNRSFLTSVGTNGNDTLRARAKGERLEGRGGSNTLYGGAGADVFDVSDLSRGTDTIWNYDPARDQIVMTKAKAAYKSGNDLVIDGTTGRRVIVKGCAYKNVQTVDLYGKRVRYVPKVYSSRSANVWYDSGAASSTSALASVYDVQALGSHKSAARTSASHASVAKTTTLARASGLAVQAKEYQVSSYAAKKRR